MDEFNISTDILNSNLQEDKNNIKLEDENLSDIDLSDSNNASANEELVASKFKVIVTDYYQILDKITVLKEHLIKLKKRNYLMINSC